ncbi:MAG TPA: glycoside hydrolase family 76 protein, partial [Verrucomicrobiae bacterium]|nr:glycoside hydrolase family 76 protein [Verrucomicrobiae bacterium]
MSITSREKSMSPAAVLSVFGIFVVLSGARAAQTDFNADTRAATVALQRYYNAQGLWDTVGWWNAANCIDALENDIVVNHDTNYLATLQKTFALNCRSNFLTGAYDDEGWWAEAWIRAYDLTGNRKYLAAAKVVFADLTTAWDEHCGGGIWWNSARTYKNAIPNELFLLLAA